MLDRKFILENETLIADTAKKRGVHCDISAFVQAEKMRRSLETEIQAISAQANAIAKDQSLAPEQKRAQGLAKRTQKQQLTQKLADLEQTCQAQLLQIPNLIHPETPIGADETSSKEIKQGITPKPQFDFEPKDHVVLGEAAGIFDFQHARQIAGPGFYYLIGDGVRLEFALQNYTLDRLTQAGFTPIITPELVREHILSGAGYRPRGDESNSYKIENMDLHLIATSEIPLCGMFADQIIEQLPIKLVGVSHCFRSERAAGRATRGLFRVHQFNKVEMLVIAEPEQSEAVHQELLALECEIFDGLEIPYRVVDVASGDLSAPAFRKYDLEAWMPERNAYAEITSTSNCTDYQARRLKIRFQQNKQNLYPHILNGTGMAIGRAMIALMENHQQKNGAIAIPHALQSYFGKAMISP